MIASETPPLLARARRSLFADLAFLVALASFLGCLHHAVRADRPLFAAPRNPGYKSLRTASLSEVHSELGRPGIVLVDARPEHVYQKGTIPGSLSLPLHTQIEEGQLKAMLGARRVIVFCSSEHCNASKELAVILKSRGVEQVQVFTGGMEQWKRAGYPVSRGDSVSRSAP